MVAGVSFAGSALATTNQFNATGINSRVVGRAVLTVDDPLALSTVQSFAATIEPDGDKKDRVGNLPQAGVIADYLTVGYDWFERIHVIARRYDFGNILTTQQTDIEIFSAFRHDDSTWTDFINNAGEGVDLIGEPALPTTLSPFEGIQMELLIDTVGPPSVDTTLDFVTSAGTIMVPITLERVVLFFEPPQVPYRERLEFLTDIMPGFDGNEQRVALRRNPRQFFEWEFMLEDDGVERSRIDSVLFEWQTRVFGIPIWHEESRVTSPIAVAQTTFTMDTTDFADYREESLILIYESPTKFDVLTIAVGGIAPTSITVDNGPLNSYATGTRIMPLRVGVIQGLVSGERYSPGHQRLRITFRVTDNDSDLADTTGWSQYNSKVLLDDCNVMTRDTLEEEFEQEVIVIDSESGQSTQDSPWATNRRAHTKTFRAVGKAGLWAVRQLVHALRGRQVSFYLPSFTHDMQADSNLVMGSNQLDIVNIGYTQFVRQRPGKNVIRIEFNNGDPPLIRAVTASLEVDATRESLTLDGNWPSAVPIAEIEAISYVEKVRFDSDSFEIRHERSNYITLATGPVRGVFE